MQGKGVFIMNENNSKTISANETDYQETKGEIISKLLWWLIGLTAARLVFHIYELTGGYVPVPNMGNQAVYLLFSAAATFVLISLGKYGKLYKICGILAAASCVTKLILPFTRGVFSNSIPNADADNFLEMLNGLTQAGPIYKLLSQISTWLPIIASVLVGIAHMKFSKPMDEKISKGWKIALIAYIAIFLLSEIYLVYKLYFPPYHTDFSMFLYKAVNGLAEAVILAEYAFQTFLLYRMAKKVKDIE